MNEWPHQIPHEGGVFWPVGIYPLRQVLFVENKQFLKRHEAPHGYCKHAVDDGTDADGDELIKIPRSIFSGHEWATGERDVHWLCLDCLLERASQTVEDMQNDEADKPR